MKTIALALLILALPVLLGLSPDPETVQGHLETCPNCVEPGSNPIRCEVAVEINRRNYLRRLETARCVNVDDTGRR